MDTVTGNRARGWAVLLWGALALVLPACAEAFVYVANLGKDVGVVVLSLCVLATTPTALVMSVLALRRIRRSSAPQAGLWQARVGLCVAVVATCVYVIGGLTIGSLLWTVLRRD